MLAEPLPIVRMDEKFDHIEIDATESGAIGIVGFKNTQTGQKLCSAILLPADSLITLSYQEDSAAYPIYFPNGEVSVGISFLINNSEKHLYATITCTSPCGKTRQQMHGLGPYQ